MTSADESLRGLRVALVGRFAGADQRAVGDVIRTHGGEPVSADAKAIDLVVVGEDSLPFDETGALDAGLAKLTQPDGDRMTDVVSETQLWQRLGLVDGERNVHRLYTPRMLAALVGVPVAVIRRWQRRGLIRPVREVLKLPYFDFQEVATARRLAELLAAGVPPREIERQLELLRRYLPNVERPLAQLSIMLAGKELLLRQGDGLVEPGGQLRFDFDRPADELQNTCGEPIETISPESCTPESWSADQMIEHARTREDEGDLAGAIELYRTALAAAGPQPRWVFELAELLYAAGDLLAARERYYMAVELDENLLEARANLGCVLAETGELTLAAAALRGAISLHPDFPDAHFHLARALEQLGDTADAEWHRRRFLELAPDSPWAEAIRQHVALADQ